MNSLLFGRAETEILEMLRSAQDALMSGGIINSISNGELGSSVRQIQMHPQELIDICCRALYELSPTTYPQFATCNQNRTKPVISQRVPFGFGFGFRQY